MDYHCYQYGNNQPGHAVSGIPAWAASALDTQGHPTHFVANPTGGFPAEQAAARAAPTKINEKHLVGAGLAPAQMCFAPVGRGLALLCQIAPPLKKETGGGGARLIEVLPFDSLRERAAARAAPTKIKENHLVGAGLAPAQMCFAPVGRGLASRRRLPFVGD